MNHLTTVVVIRDATVFEMETVNGVDHIFDRIRRSYEGEESQ